MELQLKAQRQEAAVSRDRIAVADVMGVANGFLAVADTGLKDIQAHTLAFRSASFRWQMEIDDLNLVLDLVSWANVLNESAKGKYVAQQSPGHDEAAQVWGALLTNAVSTVFSFGLTWHRLPDERTDAVRNFKKSRIELERQIEEASTRFSSSLR